MLKKTAFEQVQQLVFKATSDGVLLVDAETGSIVGGNSSLLKLLGFTTKELSQRRVWEIGFLNGPLRNRRSFGVLRCGHSSGSKFWTIRTRQGRRFDAALECSFFRFEGVGFLQFTIRDLTERRRLEAILWEREERFRKLFENSQLGVVLLYPDLHVCEINQAFTRITGYDDVDMKRLTLRDITHPEHLSADRKIMRIARNCVQDDYHAEKRYIGKRGQVVWTNTHIGAVCDEGGRLKYYQAIIEDITERKQIEARLAEQNIRDLEKEKTIQKLKDEFIFIAAHELRAPVTAISWSLELLKEVQTKPAAQPADLTEYLGTISENTARLNKLVSELLEVSRLEYGTFKVVSERFQLAPVLERAVAALGTLAAERSVSIKVMPTAAGSMVAYGNPGRVYEVLINLLTNAIKYNRVEGSVTIRTAAGGGELHVSVEDTGFGLSPDDITKLFKKFSRIETAETGEVAGTGLGLFIVKQTVERMGGKVWVKSAGRGQGSVFGFSLPQKVKRS
ncbi:MAG: PAS domain S-box protein [Patescibacteria group bacterium]|jgi:PAS domain S-box-containing protein